MPDDNKPLMIDSHAHLDYPQLSDDLDGVLARANAAGVTHIITIGVKLSTADAPKAIAAAHDNVWFSVGIHPHEAKNEPDAANTDAIRKAANHPKCVAIGEAGLDYFYDYATPQQQADSFRAQIAVARELDLPIIGIYACRVLNGEYCRGQQDMREPPPRPGRGHLPYDSTVDDTARPEIYVTYKDSQAYPEYLISFRLDK